MCTTAHAIHGPTIHTIQSHKLGAYDDIDTMTATLQHLHMSELLHHNDDAVDPYGPNDIDLSRMFTGG